MKLSVSENCEWEKADHREANLWGPDLLGADLTGADLTGADLTGADLTGADLTGADLWGANLRGADLRGADLRRANLRGEDLRRADLRGADLRGEDLRRADLRGADLRGNIKFFIIEKYEVYLLKNNYLLIGCKTLPVKEFLKSKIWKPMAKSENFTTKSVKRILKNIIRFLKEDTEITQ